MEIMNDKEYGEWIGGIARRYRQSQIKATTAVNVEMLKFYWSLGADIVRFEKDQPWGSKFMQRVSADLKVWMPEAKCFSVRNLQYMRLFVELYRTREIAQQPVAQLESGKSTQQVVAQINAVAARAAGLRQFEQVFPNVSRMLFAVPWGHHVHIMDKFKEDQRVALFYVRKTVENGWSRAMLENNIASNLHLRQGNAERGKRETKQNRSVVASETADFPRGNPERRMCGVRKLTHTTYAISAYDA